MNFDESQFPIKPLWSQQPSEPNGAYGIFKAYMLLPEGKRSLKRAYHRYLEMQGKKPANPGGDLANLAKVWKWEERAKLYDAYRLKQADAEWIDREVELREQMFLAGSLLFDKAIEALKGVEPEKIPLPLIPKYLDMAVKLMERAKPNLDKEALDTILQSLPPERKRRVLTILMAKLTETIE